jgi:hypothetical protein
LPRKKPPCPKLIRFQGRSDGATSYVGTCRHDTSCVHRGSSRVRWT